LFSDQIPEMGMVNGTEYLLPRQCFRPGPNRSTATSWNCVIHSCNCAGDRALGKRSTLLTLTHVIQHIS
jgi:hypothetical protein